MPLRIAGATSGYAELIANAIGSNNTLTVPTVASGTLVAANAAGGINVQSIAASSGSNISIPTGSRILGADVGSVRAPGTVLQVQTVIKTDQFTTTSTSAVDITGFSVSITPIFSTSRILVFGQVNISLSGNGGDAFVRLVRDSTVIGSGNGGYFAQVAGQDYFQVHSKTIVFLDSPATTSATTYKIQGWVGGNTLYINGRGLDGGFVTSSQIAVMEIAQ